MHPDTVSVGERAPGFTLPAVEDGEIREVALSDRPRPLVVNFYVADFHPACTTHVCSIRDMDWFQFSGVDVLGISTDRLYAHREFADRHGLSFPLVEDRHGEIAAEYGVLGDAGPLRDVARRSVFVVDADRRVTYAWTAEEAGEQPDLGDVRDAVEQLDP